MTTHATDEELVTCDSCGWDGTVELFRKHYCPTKSSGLVRSYNIDANRWELVDADLHARCRLIWESKTLEEWHHATPEEYAALKVAHDALRASAIA